jgi:hypothetical protein
VNLEHVLKKLVLHAFYGHHVGPLVGPNGRGKQQVVVMKITQSVSPPSTLVESFLVWKNTTMEHPLRNLKGINRQVKRKCRGIPHLVIGRIFLIGVDGGMFEQTQVRFSDAATPGTFGVYHGTIVGGSWRRHIKIEEVVDRL